MTHDTAIDGLPPLKEVVRRHGLTAQKALGQNFLFDLNLTLRIARAAVPLNPGTVIEVGSGPGALTRALLFCGAENVIAVEQDRRCEAVLAELQHYYPTQLSWRMGDALELNLAHLGPAPRKVVANLPYYAGTELLIRWLHQLKDFDSFTLMFQKEVAERITAAPGGKTYGRLAVLCQHLCRCEILFDVHPAAFTPPPRVTSAVVRLFAKQPTQRADIALNALEKVTAAAFGQRRKMLRTSLKSISTNPVMLIEQAGLTPTDRAEVIPVDGFIALTRAWLNSRAHFN